MANCRLLSIHHTPDYWCQWVTGTTYGIIAPLTVVREEFDIERWYPILQDQKVSVWYTAPTAVRMMMKVGTKVTQQYNEN